MLCLKKKKFNETYNVGTGKKTTIKNLIYSIAQVLEKKDIIIEEIKNTKGDLMGSYADLSKIKKDLGFRPKVELKNGLKEMLIDNK
jgi:nucleoside-diphosphate-sugar epimerase